MARLLFEEQTVRTRRGSLSTGVEYVVYSDPAGTVLADISATSGATATSTATVVSATSTVTSADIAGLGPASLKFYGPDGVDTLYLRCPADPDLGVQELEADSDERLDALEAASGAHPNLAVHDALGLATDAELSAHALDTSSVHGITDTTVLATDAEVTSAVSGHAAGTDPHGDRAYADAIAQGLDVKASVLVASTANLTLSGEQTIDGVLTSVSRVLVKNQTAGAANGIYVSAAGAWSRATDADTGAEVDAGTFVFVESGTVNGGSGWAQTVSPVTLGTTALVFSQFSGGGTVLGGAGLVKTGNVLDVGAGTGIAVAADTVGIAPGGVTNTQVNASAGIAESKLALNFPTHAESHAARHAAAGADSLTGYVLDASHTLAAHDTLGLVTDAILAAHEADTTVIHGITDTSALATTSGVTSAVSTHEAAADPHAGYLLESAQADTVVTVAAADTPAVLKLRADYTCDGTADEVQINAALVALGAVGGVVQLLPGTFSIAATVTIAASNARLVGSGMGITKIVCAASMTGNTPAIQVNNPTVGTDRALTANTAVGNTTVTMSAGDVASFAVGDAVLLKSSKQIDSEDLAKKAGEVHKVTAVNGGTGVVTLDDVIHDAYLTADSAKLTKVTMLANVGLEDLSVTTLAPTSTLTVGFIHFRFVENLTVSRVEMHDAYVGLQLHSCVNSRVEGCWIYKINDVVAANNLRYGIWVGSASQNVTIAGCRFSHTRHAVTTGGSSGTNYEGVQRNITVSNCTSELSDTAHFDTHEPADGVTFSGCTAIGGVPDGGTGAVVGIQTRAKNVTISGCVIRDIPGRGIMVFNAAAVNTTIVGNTISGILQSVGGSTDGIGIYFDASGTSRHLISGNTITNCVYRAISGSSANHDVTIVGNLIDNCPTTVAGVSIYFSAANRIGIVGNRISNNATGRPIQMSGASDSWLITGNYIYNNSNNAPALVGSANVVADNFGVATNTDVAAHAALADPHTGYVLESLVDAKGDLYAASADNTPAKLTAGANDTVLTADSAQATGLKWAAPAAHPNLATHDALGLATDAELTTHAGAADPHTGYVLESLVDAKGDLYAGSAADTVARLAVGADGTVLKAASGQATGLQWAAETAHPNLATHDGLGLATDAELSTHAGAADPHTGYVLESLVDAKGDLIAGSAADTVARLAVGANDTILTADSTAGAGVKWAAPAAAAGTAGGDLSGTYPNPQIGTGVIVNADVNASAAIAYAKLALATSIVNADIATAAAIAYSKLNLATSIVNADIAAGAAIAKSKLAALAIADADVASGAAIAYSKLALTGAILNADLAGSIAYSKLALTGAILNADLAGSIALTKLAVGVVEAQGGGKETLQAHGAMGATETFDLANGNVHTGTLDAACVFTFTGSTASKGCSFSLILTQDGTGSRLVTWPASVKWPSGAAPTLSTGANKVDVLTFVTVDNGTTWLGFTSGIDLR